MAKRHFIYEINNIVNNPMIYAVITHLDNLCILVMSLNLWVLDYISKP